MNWKEALVITCLVLLSILAGIKIAKADDDPWWNARAEVICPSPVDGDASEDALSTAQAYRDCAVRQDSLAKWVEGLK